ncbi:siphovirus Gp157 family protein [Lactiplantibacillus plantarum]|uniref:siphovirus Gp157 family protein n=1 Tax=Lactiplantibacillus plantarum TaxID=1590 RepID=UPI0021A60293|nr:siphovirus Gp157 family protein [Lactiplantibacillus plantarum]MCT3223582.1 siphovirus Gp157 family protein [Lactiplantibacillus plantarum]
MKLYEMATNYQQLSNREDLDPETVADTLDSIKDSMEVKVDNIASWMDDNTADIEFMKKRIKLMQEEKKRLENLNGRLNGYLADTLDQAEIKKLTTDQHIVSVRNYRASTVVDDVDSLPANFINEKRELKPDTTAIYNVLKDGGKVTGAHLQLNRKAVIK